MQERCVILSLIILFFLFCRNEKGLLNFVSERKYFYSLFTRAVHSGGAKGAVAPARKTKCFFSNIVSDFAGLFLVAILVRNLTKTEFAPADKKS